MSFISYGPFTGLAGLDGEKGNTGSKGNIGIGLSPETDHYSAYVNIDFGLSGLLGSASSGTNTTFLTNNAYLKIHTTYMFYII